MTEPAAPKIHFGRAAPSIAVRDIQAACDFYVKIFGFQKQFANGDPVRFVILRREAAELHLQEQPDHCAPAGNVAHIRVDDIDALYALCRKEGVHIVKPLADKDYGQRAFVFADPDGNRIDIGQSAIRFENRRMDGAVFRDVSLAGARFEDVNLAGAVFTNVNFSNVSIDDAKIDGLTLFGLDVAALVRSGR